MIGEVDPGLQLLHGDVNLILCMFDIMEELIVMVN